MDYLRINQRRVKEIELPRWVSYFLQIPLTTKAMISSLRKNKDCFVPRNDDILWMITVIKLKDNQPSDYLFVTDKP
jgi:hypothetical protein